MLILLNVVPVNYPIISNIFIFILLEWQKRESKERSDLVLYGGLELVYSGVQALVDLTGAHLHIIRYKLIRSVLQFRERRIKLAFPRN